MSAHAARTLGKATAARAPRSGSRRQRGAVAVFIAPFLALFLLVFVAPIVYSAVQSLYARRSSGALGLGGVTTKFVGLANFREVLHSGVYWQGMGRVFLFGVVQVPFMLLAALALALALDSIAARGVAAFRTAYFLPYAIPGVVAALLWSYLYIPQLSPYTKGLDSIGLHPDFLGPHLVLWSIANITTWSYTGYNMLIIFASLKTIPAELFEAARMDGASEWTIAWRVKVPSVRRALVLTGVLSIIGTLQLFTEPTVLDSISDSVDKNYTPTMYAFTAAFSDSDSGLASAASIVVALIAGVLSVLYYRFTTGKADACPPPRRAAPAAPGSPGPPGRSWACC
jgi:multiple sugar transport system permease protein